MLKEDIQDAQEIVRDYLSEFIGRGDEIMYDQALQFRLTKKVYEIVEIIKKTFGDDAVRSDFHPLFQFAGLTFEDGDPIMLYKQTHREESK